MLELLSQEIKIILH